MTDDRRIKTVYVSFALWLNSLMNDRAVKCVNMPRDAKIVHAFSCSDRMGRDVGLWLSSPDFPEVTECALLEEYRLEFKLLRDEPAVTAMANALRVVIDKSDRLCEFGADVDKVDIHDFGKIAKAALDAYEATFVKVEL